MADNKLVVVTGYKELDAKLRTLEPKLQRKFVRGALRKGSKRIQQEFKRIVRAEAFDTGAYEKTTKVGAMKRSRKRIGIAFFTDTEKLYARYESKHGHQPHPAKGKNEPFFYPAVLEFGSEHHEPVRPMRRALYDNEAVYREYFKADLRQFITEQKVTLTLPKASGYTGRKFSK